MTRRQRIVAAAGILAALVGVAAVAELGPFAGPGDAEDAGARLARVSPPRDSAPAGITLRTSPRAPALTRPRRVQVDLARVEAALARLEKSTARITPEQIAAEQRRMIEAKARFEAIQIAEPKIRKYTDEHGTRWIELQHESGELRYQLDPGDPEPDTGSK